MSQGGRNDEADKSIEDERTAPRKDLVQLVWYKVLDVDPEGMDPAPEGISKMCDISATGIGLQVTHPLPIGNFIFTEISTRSFTLSAVGRIVYSRLEEGGLFRIGIHFLVIPPNDRWYLFKFFKGDGKD